MSNFNRLAGIYDALARLVFGSHIADAQKQFLHLIPGGAEVLIIGGGTGWIIEEVKREAPDSTICYIELSERMLFLARSAYAAHDVIFIQGDENDIPAAKQFDVVITHFFLDLFPNGDLEIVLSKIRPRLKPGATWIVSDFVNEKRWHNVLLWIMYRFFRLTANVSASVLPSWEEAINRLGYAEIKSRYYYNAFIKSAVFRKI